MHCQTSGVDLVIRRGLNSEWVKQWLEDIPATTSPLSQ